MSIIAISPDDTDLILNGHKFTGFADANDAIMAPDITSAEYKWGADGEMLGGSTGKRGEILTVKLLPTSRTFLGFLLPILEREQSSGTKVTFNGGLYYRSLNISVSLETAQISVHPSLITIGNSFAGNVQFGFAVKTFRWITTGNRGSNLSLQ